MTARHLRSSILAPVLVLSFLVLSLSGCASAYYGAWEKLGKDKRDLLVERVVGAKESQEEAQEDFRDALDVFRELVQVDADELEEMYDRMEGAYERSVDQADEVRDRIDQVESVSEDLFREWEDELDDYNDPALRRESASGLREARSEFRDLLRAMRRAEASMDPPLRRFSDQVLFLKHNLNARAVASLEMERQAVTSDVEALVRQMERSIAEAEAFVRSMRGG